MCHALSCHHLLPISTREGIVFVCQVQWAWLYNAMTHSPLEAAANNFAALERFKWFLKGRGATEVVLNGKGPESDCKKAAVLFLMREGERDELEVLLTKRSYTVTTHVGEHCLPGGMFDAAKDSNLVDTALRETEEEVGIGKELVRVVAELPPAPSGWVQFMAVTTVIGILKAEKIIPRPNDEVDDVFWAPLQFFLSNQHHSTAHGRWWNSIASTDFFEYWDTRGGVGAPVWRTIWGLTSRICVAASAIAFNRHPDFPYTTSFVHHVSLEPRRAILMQIALTQEDTLQHECDTVIVCNTIRIGAKL